MYRIVTQVANKNQPANELESSCRSFENTFFCDKSIWKSLKS